MGKYASEGIGQLWISGRTRLTLTAGLAGIKEELINDR